MHCPTLPRRTLLLGLTATLGGCGAIASLDAASQPLDTFDLRPAPGSETGPRSNRTLVVARPEPAAALDTDRIVIKPRPTEINYLAGARWSDEVAVMMQNLLIRAISSTGRVGYVGSAEGGPVPDNAVLTRIDAFQAEVRPDAAPLARIELTLAVVDDAEQRVLASRSFAASVAAAGDSPAQVVAALQAVLDALLPDMADWVLARLA